ncbi:MAG: AraC family transcriptional regulator [Nibricoccus sp.]
MNSGPNDYPSVTVDPERPFDSIRELYLYREPELIGAMLRGDRCSARKIINHILVHIYSVGEIRLELLKGLLLELVVMMARATVEAGVEQADVLGMHFRHLTELAELRDDEELADWLKRSFERIFTALEQQEKTDSPPRVARALAYMRDHLDREITREEVAQHAGISPGHFSHLLRARTGRSFTELLRSFRIEAACGLLRTTDRTLAEIAAACGFCDQSYFTNVFRDQKQTTPRLYRESVRANAT